SFEANAVQDQAPPAILAILRKRLAEIDAARDFVAKTKGFSVWADPSLAPDRWQGSRAFCRSILEMQCVRLTRIIRQGLVTMARSPDSLPLWCHHSPASIRLPIASPPNSKNYVNYVNYEQREFER